MKTITMLGTTLLLTGSLFAADPNPKEDVTSAATKLGGKDNYSWKTVVVVPEGAPFKPGPTDGKTEKGGVTYFTLSFGDNSTHIYLKGDQAAVTNPDGGWQSLAELDGNDGPGRFLSRIIKNFKAPAAQAKELADSAKELKKEGDTYSGDMTEEGAKGQFRFGNASGAKGSVKFWVKDGQLSKYQFKVTAKVDFNGNEIEVDRDTTVEIKDVGTTKIEVPADAKKKLEPAPAPAVAPAEKKSA
jgi:hypothetical protein